MTESEWLASTDPWAMLEFLLAKASDRKLRLFAVACCRRVAGLITGDGPRQAILLAERLADGQASEEERELAEEAGIEVLGENEADEYAGWACAIALSADLRPPRLRIGGLYPDVLQVAYRCWRARWESTRHEGDWTGAANAAEREEQIAQAALVLDLFGSHPLDPVSVTPRWRTRAIEHLAEVIYADHAFGRLPILADALEDAGCTDADNLGHRRGPGPHVRGCWVVDLILGKQ